MQKRIEIMKSCLRTRVLLLLVFVTPLFTRTCFIAASNARKHVLCEMYMATSREEAQQMVATASASANNKNLMSGHNQRFVSSHVKARQAIVNGAVGKIYSFRTVFVHPGPET